MATVKFRYGNRSQLDKKSIEDGVVYVTEDTQEFAIDLDGKRIFPNNIEYPISIAKGGTGANNAEDAYRNLGGGTVGKINTIGSTTLFLRGDGTWQEPIGSSEDTKVTQTLSDENADYRILFSNTADDTTRTETARKATNLTFNPSTGMLSTTTFAGQLKGTADSAVKLATSRNLAVALGTSDNEGAAFDGSANQLAIPVSGTLKVENGGTGATSASAAWTALGGGSVGKLNTGSSTTTYLRNDGQWSSINMVYSGTKKPDKETAQIWLDYSAA